MANIVKQVYQKTNSDQPISYSIGAEAEHIDMKSILNLEEELKIGGNKKTSITSNLPIPNSTEKYTQIIQYYTSTTQSAVSSNTNYTNFIYVKDMDFLTEENPIVVNEEEIQYLGENPTTTIIDVSAFGSSESAAIQVISHLYIGYKEQQNDYTNLLHQKIVKMAIGGN